MAGNRFIVGGDWNNAVLFDTIYPPATADGPGPSTEFFARRAESGWHHALRRFHPEELRTYLEPGAAPYELDHIFTDAELHSELVACDVLDGPVLTGLSDHAPLLAEFKTGP